MVRNGMAIAVLFRGNRLWVPSLTALLVLVNKRRDYRVPIECLVFVLSAIRMRLIVSALLFFMGCTFTSAHDAIWWKQSILIPEFGVVVNWFFEFMKHSSSFIK